jgi:hypothetical protein
MVRLAARRLLSLLVAALVLSLFAPFASGDGRTDFLVGRLKADDFRVRTNAALALGATNDDAVVPPLCDALADSSEVVRQAVAVALKRLAKRGALRCLKARLGSESTASVKLQIARAIEAIESGGGGGGDGPAASDPAPLAPPRQVPNAKFYVAISPISNATGRAQGEIDRVVLAAIRSKLDALGAFQIAPDHESADAARSTMSKRRMKGYYLAVGVEKFDYSDGNLRVKVKVAVFTYPGKDLRGEVPAGLTQQGVRPGDKAAEDNLLGMAAGRAAELFAQNFQ